MAYATLDDLLATMSVATADADAQALLDDLLEDASAAITEMCGRSFYLGDVEARLFHVRNRGERSLSRAVGDFVDIVAGSVVSVELADQTGGTYRTVTAGSAGYWLEPQNPKPGYPFTDVLLSNIGSSFLVYPWGDETVRITAAFGWASVPLMVKRATIDLAREWFRQGPGGGGPIGIGALGQPIFGSGTPPTVRQLYMSDYRLRSFSYV